MSPDRPDRPDDGAPQDRDRGLDVDAMFAEIVAHFHEPGAGRATEPGDAPRDTTPEAPAPVDRAGKDEPEPPAPPAASEETAAPPAAKEPPTSRPRPGSVLPQGWNDPLDTGATWDDEGHFVPPTPPPLPAMDPRRKAAWAALVGCPLLVLVLYVFGLHPAGWVTATLALGFIGGFVYLVATMGSGQDRWPGDDGAVV